MKEYFDKLYLDTAENFHKLVKKNLKNEKKMFIVTANPETLMIAEENKEFKDVLIDDSTTIIADGIGVVKAAKMLKKDIKERIPGVELSEKLLFDLNSMKKKLYIFGAKKEVIEKMKSLINSKFPNINLVGAEHGYVKNKDDVFKDIEEKAPDVILVALGIPNQEMIIYKHLEKFKKGIFIGVGGTFDTLTGTVKRAPKIFIKLHLEWLYRICKEPKRFKRFYNSNVKYIKKIIKLKKEI